ncbi:MAG: hypothetical protein GXY36_15280 [Chloroflexi bacterium]|nr:hypothetical protein [Chloroflexota bacterium]
MRPLYFVVLLLLLVSLAGPTAGHAAQTSQRPLVVFVQPDQPFPVAAMSNARNDGLTQLQAIFERLGAQTLSIRLNSPLPAETDLVVLIRPQRPTPITYMVNLWYYMMHGGNLLLAIDPNGQANPDRATSALPQMLGQDYGLSLQNALVTESWFTSTTIRERETSMTRAYPGPIVHPIIAPLLAYELPVYTWGARTVSVEALGLTSRAVPLLQTRTAYAETELRVFDQNNLAPLELNLDRDQVGLLDIAAISEHTETGSRVAVLGDSEILLNGFGLTNVPGSPDPFYLGNRILAERLAAWLLELPEEEWPPLPTGVNWLAIDGQGNDWQAEWPAATDPFADTSLNGLDRDLGRVMAVRDSEYMYVLAETTERPPVDLGLHITFDTNRDGAGDLSIAAEPGAVLLDDGSGERVLLVPDARLAVSEVVELRLPLRFLPSGTAITGLCLSISAAEGSDPDCMDEPIRIGTVARRSPASLRGDNGATVMVYTSSAVLLRAGPGMIFDRLASFVNGEPLLATGRNEAGDWLLVENARYQGWIAAFLVRPGEELVMLPVVTP